MARNTKKDDNRDGLFSEETSNLYTEQGITDTLKSNYMPYAMSVIVSRAIPEIDGLKPSQRKLLYTMYKMGLLGGALTKSANVVGATMKLNPHGDQAIYETMVRMTRGNGSLLHPFIESKGNMGKHYSRDMRCAAARYTEVKLAKIARELFEEIDKDTVDFTDNYDGTMKEPTLFPVTFPSVLVNPGKGLAVGMSTNIASFNLREVCDATCAFIDDNACDLGEYIKAPDFSTGGIAIYNKSDMDDIIETGRGTVRVRARYSFDKKNSVIDITEIPYTTSSESVIDEIIALVKSGKCKEITDIRDATDKNGLKISLEIRRSTDPDALMNKLFTQTTLEDSFSSNFNILINGQPRVMGIRSILGEWLVFRINCIKRGLIFDISEKQERLHLLEGLEKILLDIDKAIAIIRNTAKDKDVIPNLCEGFDIDTEQAEFIAEIKLRNINKEYIISKTEEKSKLEEEIDELTKTLASPRRINELIKKQLQEISRKYGQDRLTGIMDSGDVVKVSHVEMIDDYKLKVFLTKESYFKKIPLVALRTSPEQKLKEDDSIIKSEEWHNKSEIVFISDRQTVYKCKLYELPESKAGLIGDYLPNLLGMEPGESIISFVVCDNYEGMLLYGFENGKICKVPFELYETKTNRKKLINAYSGSSPVVGCLFIREDIDIIVGSNTDRVAALNTQLIPLKTTKTAQGVQVLKSKRGQVMKFMLPFDDCGFSTKGVAMSRKIPATGAGIKA